MDEGRQGGNIETVVLRKAMAGRPLERLSFDNTYACLPLPFHVKLKSYALRAQQQEVGVKVELVTQLGIRIADDSCRPQLNRR